MWRVILCLAFIFLVFGCKSGTPHPTFSEDFWGKPLVVEELGRTASRKDVPAGVDPDDVLVVKSASGAAAYIAKKPKKHLWSPQKYEVAMNEQAKAEGWTPARPKASWWTWVVMVFSALLVGAGIIFAGHVKRLIFFWRR